MFLKGIEKVKVKEVNVTMNNASKKYSKYLVIFVDILGSQEKTDFSELYNINRIFHEEFETNQNNDKDHTVYFRKIYTFSDCAYIFYGFKEDIEDEKKNLGELFRVALCNCEPIFLRFLKERIVFRGGISYGEAYVDLHRSMFFGPAINRAYQLEAGLALHPRIVIDSVVAEKVKESIKQVKNNMLETNSEYLSLLGKNVTDIIPETGEGIIEIDEDNQYIFNYLHLPENNIICSDMYWSSVTFITGLIEFCHEQISIHTKYKIIDKYYYLLRFAKTKLNNLLDKVDV